MFASNKVSCKAEIFSLLFFFNENSHFWFLFETHKFPNVTWMDQFQVISYVICLYQLPLEGSIWFFSCILTVLVSDSIAGYLSRVDVYAIAINFIHCLWNVRSCFSDF